MFKLSKTNIPNIIVDTIFWTLGFMYFIYIPHMLAVIVYMLYAFFIHKQFPHLWNKDLKLLQNIFCFFLALAIVTIIVKTKIHNISYAIADLRIYFYCVFTFLVVSSKYQCKTKDIAAFNVLARYVVWVTIASLEHYFL